MATRPSGIDPHELRREVALAAHDFGEWEQPSGAKRDLMVGEIVDLLVAFGAALVVLDKDLGAVDGNHQADEGTVQMGAVSFQRGRRQSGSVRDPHDHRA
jgi:hypothetical protein